MSYPSPGSATPYPVPTTSGKAVASLVLGIVGLALCGPFAAIPAIIVGRSAQREIDASGGWQTGSGLATAGIVLGWIEVALMVAALFLVLAIFAFGR
jgi:hypothetical protein